MLAVAGFHAIEGSDSAGKASNYTELSFWLNFGFFARFRLTRAHHFWFNGFGSGESLSYEPGAGGVCYSAPGFIFGCWAGFIMEIIAPLHHAL